MQVCSLTTEYQVFQYVPSIKILEQFVCIILTICGVCLHHSQVSPLYEDLPGFAETEEDTIEGVLAVKFIISRDLAVTRPSPDSC